MVGRCVKHLDRSRLAEECLCLLVDSPESHKRCDETTCFAWRHWLLKCIDAALWTKGALLSWTKGNLKLIPPPRNIGASQSIAMIMEIKTRSIKPLCSFKNSLWIMEMTELSLKNPASGRFCFNPDLFWLFIVFPTEQKKSYLHDSLCF